MASRARLGARIRCATVLPMPRRRCRSTALVLAVASAALTVVASASAAAGSWSAGPRLAGAREFHTATLLTGTRALIAGGLRPGGPTATAEIFDAGTRRWSRAGSLGVRRMAHAAVRLRDGRVLVAGGGTFSSGSPPAYERSAEVYDPAVNRWSSAADMAIPRANHTATLLRDGRVLVAGGLNSVGRGVASAELYDPATNRWSPAGSMREPRFHHTATLLPNGKVLVAGGHFLTSDGSTVALASAELYDPGANRWSSAPPMSVRRDNHTATPLFDGRVLVAGGGTRTAGFRRSAELYDWRTDSWSRAAGMHEARGLHAATLLPSGEALAVGGFNDCGALASAELYSPAAGRWSLVRTLRTPRASHTATAFLGGQVLVAGGTTYAGSILSGTELYVPGGPDRTGPQLCRLTIRPNRLRPARARRGAGRRRARISFRVSEPGQVRFTVRRLKTGRLAGRRCAAARGPVPRRLRCVRFVHVRGGFTRRVKRGRNAFRFSGSVGGRRLPAGAYQFYARPVDRRRNAGVVVSSGFRVVP